VTSSTFQERDLAALLVGNRKGILELGVAIAKFIASTLLCFNALSASGFFSRVSNVLVARGISEAHVVVVVRVVRAAPAASGRTCGRRGGIVAGSTMYETMAP